MPELYFPQTDRCPSREPVTGYRLQKPGVYQFSFDTAGFQNGSIFFVEGDQAGWRPGSASLLSGDMIEPEPSPDEKYCVRIREYQFMKQPGVRAGKSERNSIPVLHTFTDKADNQWRVIGRITKHPSKPWLP